jgi:Fe-S-cluster containining protein
MPIRLAGDGVPADIEPDRVYFAFPDGLFTYDCVACGAICCRGTGFGLLAGPEIEKYLGSTHALRFFLDPCETGAADHLHARSLKPACFFLDAANSCSLQVRHGYDAKPENCRLFPFNQFRRAGDYLIVAPHSGQCPLTVVPDGERSSASGHAELLAAMCAGGIGLHVPEVSPGMDVSALVALERRIVALAAQSSGRTYVATAAAQLALTRIAADADAAPAAVHDQASEEIAGFFRALCQVLGIAPPDDEDRALARTMAATTPAIRALIAFKQDAPTRREEMERLPFLLVTLYAYATLARQAGMQQVTYQTITQLFHMYRSLFDLLANVDRVMTWKPDARVEFTATQDASLQARYLRVAKGLLPVDGGHAAARLGDLLCEHAPVDGTARIVFLKLLARRLKGRLEAQSFHGFCGGR